MIENNLSFVKHISFHIYSEVMFPVISTCQELNKKEVGIKIGGGLENFTKVIKWETSIRY